MDINHAIASLKPITLTTFLKEAYDIRDKILNYHVNNVSLDGTKMTLKRGTKFRTNANVKRDKTLKLHVIKKSLDDMQISIKRGTKNKRSTSKHITTQLNRLTIKISMKSSFSPY